MSGFADKAPAQILWPFMLGQVWQLHIVNKRMTGLTINCLYNPGRPRVPGDCAQFKHAKLPNVDKCS